MKTIYKIFAVSVMLMLSCLALAGSWSTPVKQYSQMGTELTSAALADVAGYPNYGQASGACTTGDVYKYYTVVIYPGIPGVARAVNTYWKQLCL